MTQTPAQPDSRRMMAAIDATWPPVEFAECAGFRLRRAAGGGNRVSAASAEGPGRSETDIAEAARAMEAWGQVPQFRLIEGEDALDGVLDGLGYGMTDPTRFYAARAEALTGGDEALWVAVAGNYGPVIMEEIWATGGIGPARLAVMDRVQGPAWRLLGRAGDRPVGCAFVAVDGDVAMIHAIEVLLEHRRKGAARRMVHAAARIAQRNGAEWLALAVTRANAPARGLYEAMGMQEVGGYHYRTANGTGQT